MVFGFSVLLPLVKAIRRNQASAGFKRIAERGRWCRPFPIWRRSCSLRQRQLSPKMEQGPISSAKVVGLVPSEQ
jgi:hypothetical protein